jgi:hypothetical protein
MRTYQLDYAIYVKSFEHSDGRVLLATGINNKST